MTVVGVLGTIHNEELRQKYNCPLELYKEIIVEFKPDIICGEVHPSAWERYCRNKNDKGYWGEPASEYGELIFPLCANRNIEFIPIDWFELDVWNNFDPFAKLSEEEKKKGITMEEEWFGKQMATSSFGSIPFNSKEFDQVTRKKYEWLEQWNLRSFNFRWTIRNLIMIERVKNTIGANQGKRILCLVGADHNYFFVDELKDQDVEFHYPLR
ncbi:hypothetical protein MJA45_04345 [Paenibacillus aurantius]|uniref:Uncharacterized protein n=1 Tax=Paenibacillus aurantius TaxID=2918900 RepID=A0AA96LFE9_9BACL|nr:hypothetical protein [Paenibacillus aurantius]WNQ12285.1 hypothetical protein MJA45_04345 [Paenibacillus aurantius]